MAFGSDTHSEMDKASMPWSKYQMPVKVIPKDYYVAFRLDTHLEVDKASTYLSKYQTALAEMMMAAASTAEPSVATATLTAIVRVTALTAEPIELDSSSSDDET